MHVGAAGLPDRLGGRGRGGDVGEDEDRRVPAPLAGLAALDGLPEWDRPDGGQVRASFREYLAGPRDRGALVLRRRGPGAGRDEGDARLDPAQPGRGGRLAGDARQLGGLGVGVDQRVGEEDDLVCLLYTSRCV